MPDITRILNTGGTLMKIRRMLLLILLYIGVALNSIVVLEEVNINSEFYGPFSKNTAEFTFFNDSNNNFKQAKCRFKLNSSAFITKLWLEIDGVLVEDDTFSRHGDSRNYFTDNDKKDPALLTKGYNATYTLSIYPFKEFERRRAVIEYYSLLESEQNQLTWLFEVRKNRTNKNNSTSIILVSNMNLPNKTIIKKDDIELIYSKENLLLCNEKDELKLSFEFQNLSEHFRIVDNSYSVILDPRRNKPKKTINRDNVTRFLLSYIEYYKSTSFYIINNSLQEDTFVANFLNYMKSKNNDYEPYSQIFENWFVRNDSVVYKDDNLPLVGYRRLSDKKSDSQSTFCSFLNEFFKYIDILTKSYDEQVSSGYLTENTAKLVLEQNMGIKKKKNSILKTEYEILHSTISIHPHPYDIDPFAIKQPPFPSQLTNISSNLGISGEVLINFEILESGNVGWVSIAKPLHSAVDSLIVKSIKQWGFSPAWKNNKCLRSSITIPIRVDKTIDANKLNKINNEFKIGNRTLISDNKKLVESTFSALNSKSIMIYSTEFFELLLDNPDLVYITYIFSYQKIYTQLGLIDKSGKSCLIFK